MADCDNTGISTNPLQVNFFQFILDRVPNITYFCQAANLPGIQFGVTEQPTNLGHPVMVPTGSIRFEELNIKFRVDENLTNWTEIQNWIKTIGNYDSDISTLSYSKKTSPATLLITNSSYKPKVKIQFRHVFPMSLAGIKFSAMEPMSVEAVSEATFAFTGYTVERLATT